MYIETSSPRVQGDSARLEKGGLSFNTTKCLSFSYHMFGTSMGELNVLVGDKTVVFTRSGNQGNAWHRASFEINYPGKSKVRKSNTIAQEQSFIRDKVGLCRACGRPRLGSAVINASICGDVRSEVYTVCSNTNFSVHSLDRNFYYKLSPANRPQNSAQVARSSESS